MLGRTNPDIVSTIPNRDNCDPENRVIVHCAEDLGYTLTDGRFVSESDVEGERRRVI